MKTPFFLICFLLFAFTNNGKPGNIKWATEEPAFLHQAVKTITDVIVHDIYSPPVASRTYAYCTIAGYEAMRFASPEYASFSGRLHGLSTVPVPAAGKKYNFCLAAVHAMLLVSKTMVISEERIEVAHEKILHQFRDGGLSAATIDNSLDFGKEVADHILAWAAKDNYRQSRSYPRYAVREDAASWKPTPPAYIKAIEPHWSKIRTFMIDSAQQFKPAPVTPFASDTASRFFKEALNVQRTVISLSPGQIAIANFWDCNPYKMNVNGHVMFATKKISPGGHWINITRLACEKAGADCIRSAQAYAYVALALADGFISCWDEKYRSNTIRPETYINQYIDKNWVPILQTPPFPEYTSGHSVVSGAASVVLTKLFGEPFAYTDSTQNEFNLQPRQFSSFRQAAEEAAISRLYGGIHYQLAITEGLKEGRRIGEFIVQRIK